MKRKTTFVPLALAVTLACSTARQAENVTPAEVRAIAKEAYIYGYPMVDSYRIEYGYFVDQKDSEYKGAVE